MRLLLIAALCLCAQAQDTPARTAPAPEPKGLPPRASADEYLSKGRVGDVAIGAEFVEHSVPTADGTYSTEDYVVVEVGLFGPAGARIKLSSTDFSLRINDKKTPQASQPYELVAHSLKDPEWSPPKEEKKESGLSTNGRDSAPPPAIVHMPVPMLLAMENHVKSAVLLSGDRALPQAGLLFFEYHGKEKTIHSVELIYNGPAGKATVALQP